MQVIIDNELVAYFDVDDTLCLWGSSKDPNNIITIRDEISTVQVTPNIYVIEALKDHKARGHAVVVWSQGGFRWAQKVVEALGIGLYVDLIIAKPRWFYDDLPASAFMDEFTRIDSIAMYNRNKEKENAESNN